MREIRQSTDGQPRGPTLLNTPSANPSCHGGGNDAWVPEEQPNVITRQALTRMDAMLNRSVVQSSTGVAASELAHVPGPWAAPGPGEKHHTRAQAMGDTVQVLFRVGLSSRAPTRFGTVSRSVRVSEILAKLLASDARLRNRSGLCVADHLLNELDGASQLGEHCQGKPSITIVLCASGGAGAALPAGQGDSRRQTVVSSSVEAGGGGGKTSTGRLGSQIFAGPSAQESAQQDSSRNLYTLMYRIGRDSTRAPRSLKAGPQSTVQDVLEEIADRDASVAARLGLEELRLVREATVTTTEWQQQQQQQQHGVWKAQQTLAAFAAASGLKKGATIRLRVV